jgi:tripeptidyl-peptidase-2
MNLLLTHSKLTSDGKPKIVDLVDATGSGDVDCTTISESSADGQVQVHFSISSYPDIFKGLSGRTLKLGKWNNRDGLRYRLGIKRGYELFPKPLVDRLKTERKKLFDVEQRNAVTLLKR